MKILKYFLYLIIFSMVFTDFSCNLFEDDIPEPDPVDTTKHEEVAIPLNSFSMEPFGGEEQYMNPTEIFSDTEGNFIMLDQKGLKKSVDNGASWFPLLSRNIGVYAEMAKAPDGTIYYVTRNNGLSKTQGNSNSWGLVKTTTLDKDAKYVDAEIIAPTNNEIYILLSRHATLQPKFYYSADGGVTLIDKSELLPDLDGQLGFMEMVKGEGDKVFFSCKTGLYKSSDKGDSWTQVTTESDIKNLYVTDEGLAFFRRSSTGLSYGGSVKDGDWTTLKIYGIIIGKNADGHLVMSGALDDYKSIFRSIDGGIHWSAYGTQEALLKMIAFNDEVNLTISDKKVYYNPVWDVIWYSYDPPKGEVSDILFMSDTIVVATSDRIVLSPDNGKTWSRQYKFSENRYSPNVLSHDPQKNQIIVGTKNGEPKLVYLDANLTAILNQVNFPVLDKVTGFIHSQKYISSIVSLGSNDGDKGLIFVHSGHPHTQWIEKRLPLWQSYVHDLALSITGETEAIYIPYENQYGSTGIGTFLLTAPGEIREDGGFANLNHLKIKTLCHGTAIKNGKKLPSIFFGIDDINRLWFTRGGKWILHGDFSELGEINKVRLGPDFHLYIMSKKGVWRSDVIIE